jgi:Fe-S cluster assembly ATP-binding protein
MADLEIRNLHVSVGEKKILKGITLGINRGEVHAIMGPNGSGKSTLANTLMGHPNCRIVSGSITFLGKDLAPLKPHSRARLGIFLSFQYPQAIPGVSVSSFLRTALNSISTRPVPVPEFVRMLKEKMDMLKIDHSFMSRYLNDGFSGGEKKRTEILQMAVLQPKIAILDETDSGLDVDALKTVARGVNNLLNPGMGVLLITHYQRLLNYIKPDRVHVMLDGKIAKSGGPDLAVQLEERGYDWLKEGSKEAGQKAGDLKPAAKK